MLCLAHAHGKPRSQDCWGNNLQPVCAKGRVTGLALRPSRCDASTPVEQFVAVAGAWYPMCGLVVSVTAYFWPEPGGTMGFLCLPSKWKAGQDPC